MVLLGMTRAGFREEEPMRKNPWLLVTLPGKFSTLYAQFPLPQYHQVGAIRVGCLPTGVIELHKFSSVHSWAVSIDFVDQEGVLSFLAPGGFYDILSSTFGKTEVHKYHESNMSGISHGEGWNFCYSSSLERESLFSQPLTGHSRKLPQAVQDKNLQPLTWVFTGRGTGRGRHPSS